MPLQKRRGGAALDVLEASVLVGRDVDRRHRADAWISATDHSSQTPTSPSSSDGKRGCHPAAWARLGSTITAGISPGLAGPWRTPISAPETSRTASMTSSTDSDVPEP